MRTCIKPELLKMLREKRNLSQADLAHKTAQSRSPVSLSTIKRIEGAKLDSRASNPRVVRALAQALDVQPDELTGGHNLADRDRDHLSDFVTLKDKISRQTDLSFQAVETLYGISRSAQVKMAPFFAALFAESSLRWRQGRLTKLDAVTDSLNDLRGDNPLLATALVRAEQANEIERRSIEQRDVLGHQAFDHFAAWEGLATSEIDGNFAHLSEPRYRGEWASPFYLYLKAKLEELRSEQIELDPWGFAEDSSMADGTADYLVGGAFIDSICGRHSFARFAIEYGHVNLNEIPEELMAPERMDDRIAFLVSRIPQEARREHAVIMVEAMSGLFPEEDSKPLEARVDAILQRLEEGGI